jgi:hypothetical protein
VSTPSGVHVRTLTFASHPSRLSVMTKAGNGLAEAAGAQSVSPLFGSADPSFQGEARTDARGCVW